MTRALRYGDLCAAWLTDLTACVTTTMEANPVKPYTNEQFEQAVEDLRAFARERGAAVSAEVAGARTRAGLLQTARPR